MTEFSCDNCVHKSLERKEVCVTCIADAKPSNWAEKKKLTVVYCNMSECTYNENGKCTSDAIGLEDYFSIEEHCRMRDTQELEMSCEDFTPKKEFYCEECGFTVRETKKCEVCKMLYCEDCYRYFHLLNKCKIEE